MEGKICLAYNKSALSVIENVIYAHDAEKKWIQNHPTILYEHFILQHAMRSIDKYLKLSETGNRIFSYESLTYEGHNFPVLGKISLLSDDDILHIMKNTCSDLLISEYFSRNMRRHPIWKSEAEYNALFLNVIGSSILDKIESSMQKLEKYLFNNLSLPVINNSVLEFLYVQKEKIEENKAQITSQDYSNILGGIVIIEKIVLCFKTIAEQYAFPFDYVIISARKFMSSFIKQDLSEIIIDFPSLNITKPIKDVSTILTSEKTREGFFYLFIKDRNDNGEKISLPIKEIIQSLTNELFRLSN